MLDVGGGTGGFAVPLAEAGHRVTVVDASPDALAALTRRAAEAGVADRVRAVQGDGDALAGLVEPASADLVLCHAVLEVVDDPAAVVAALAAALRPGGAASVLVAGRAAAVLARAMNGHLDAAAALLADPDGTRRPAGHPAPPLRRRRRRRAAGRRRAARSRRSTAYACSPTCSRPPSPTATRAPCSSWNWPLAARPPYRDIAAQLHLFARRPA